MKIRTLGNMLFATSLALQITIFPVNAQGTTGSTQPAIPVISGQLSLADAVQTALKNSPMIRTSGAQARAAEARVGMASAMTRPQLSASAFAGTSTMGDIITSPPNVMPQSIFAIPDRSNITGQVGLMVPIFTGGRLSSAVRAARGQANAATSDSATTQLETATQTRMAYHTALLAQSTVGVYEDLVRQALERVRIAEVALKEGRIATYDLLRNQAALADAQQQLNNARRDAQTSMFSLTTTMGVAPTSNVELSDPLAFPSVNGDVTGFIDTALKNRPELKAARARVDAAQAQVSVAKSAYSPQVYANAMEGVSATSDDTESGFTVGLTVGIPILDGGLRQSGVREARSMLDAMRADEAQVRLTISNDVRTAIAQLETADQNARLSEAAVTQTQEDYRVIRLRYEAGKAVNVEVLDALASLVRAQNNRLTALYEYNVASDRLARATGVIQ